MSVETKRGAVESVSQSTVDVGRVFGESGTDGLILYALILATFLMFLALISVGLLLRRSLASLDSQTKTYTAASEKTAEAIKELASSISASHAGAQTHQMLIATTLSRLELRLSYDGEKGEGP